MPLLALSSLLATVLTAEPSGCAKALAADSATLKGWQDRFDAPTLMNVTAESLLDSCAEQLPKSMAEALRIIKSDAALNPASASAEAVAVIVKKTPALWSRVCPAGAKALSAAASSEERRQKLFDDCGWTTLGLGSREDVGNAQAPELAAALFGVLRDDAKIEVNLARQYARALGGFDDQLPEAAPPPPPTAQKPSHDNSRHNKPGSPKSRTTPNPKPAGGSE
jgi:hypothetical protein